MSRPPNICAYCGQPGKSKEHYWGLWSLKYNPTNTQFYEHELKGPAGIRLDDRRWRQGNIRKRQIKVVCKACNTGWMKKLNEDAEPILAKMAVGKWPEIDSERRLAAAWLTMLTMSLEFHDLRTMATRQCDRSSLRETLEPPEGWTILIGPHNAPGWTERVGHTGLGIWRPGNEPRGNLKQRFRHRPSSNFQITVSTFGKMAFCTNSAHSDALLSIEPEKFVSEARVHGFHVLWPIVPGANDMNFTRQITDAGMDAVANNLFRALGGV